MAEVLEDAPQAHDIERELERSGIALRIDWNNDAQVRNLAREAMDYIEGQKRHGAPPKRQPQGLIRLFELVALMLHSPAEHHGQRSPAWRALVRALWIESNLRDPG